MRKQPTKIDCSKNKHFLCMLKDAQLLENLIEQKTRAGFKDTDYIQPGLLAGQSLISVLWEITKSIQNHLDYFERENIIL